MDLDLVTTLRSTGAVREFQPGPVGDDVLRRILETARFAPSGGNRQGWRVIVVKDPSVRAALRDIYLTGPGWSSRTAPVLRSVVTRSRSTSWPP